MCACLCAWICVVRFCLEGWKWQWLVVCNMCICCSCVGYRVVCLLKTHAFAGMPVFSICFNASTWRTRFECGVPGQGRGFHDIQCSSLKFSWGFSDWWLSLNVCAWFVIVPAAAPNMRAQITITYYVVLCVCVCEIEGCALWDKTNARPLANHTHIMSSTNSSARVKYYRHQTQQSIYTYTYYTIA